VVMEDLRGLIPGTQLRGRDVVCEMPRTDGGSLARCSDTNN